MLCQRCGTDARDAKFCPSCGAPVQPEQVEQQPALFSQPPINQPKKKFGCLKIGAICVLAVIVTLVLLVTLDGDDRKVSSEASLEEQIQQIRREATIDSPESMAEYVKSLAGISGLKDVEVVATSETSDTYNVFVSIKGRDSLTSNLTRVGVLSDAEDVFILLQNDDCVSSVGVDVSLTLTDQYGNEKEGNVLSILLSKEKLDKINFDNFNADNFSNIADYYYLHPALNDT